MESTKFLLVLILYVLSTMSGYAAPLLRAKNSWDRNVFATVIKTTCSSDGQCREWLPILGNSDNTILDDTLRLQSRSQIANLISTFTLESWKDNMLEETMRQIRLSSPTNKQIPTRITKKDVFTSRNWGAIPVSARNLSSYYQRSNHAVIPTSTTSQQEQKSRKTTDNSLSPSLEPSIYRIPLRNGQPTVQRRRRPYTNFFCMWMAFFWKINHNICI